MGNLELIRDFLNTADLEQGTDELGGAGGLRDWLLANGLAKPRHRASDEDAAEARAVREALRELAREHTGATADRDIASRTLDIAARNAGLQVRFRDGAIGFVPSTSGGLGTLLAAVGESMADGSWRRLKACRSDTCRWAFIDEARNQSRQWCDMRVCGNRAKARTFRGKRA
ncbi:MAG TPA: CGNR zinc finger domain-containing protein [Gaiellaceae bacterium]|nr:CGNR zinc finger domain-containing protein [Gaiellaceae bacterium]